MKKLVLPFAVLLFGMLTFQPANLLAEEADLSKLFGGHSNFLDVDDAFKPSTEVVDGEIIIRFDIADEYYLYRSRLKFSAEGAILAEAYIPDGKKKVDEYLGNVEVYHHTLEVSVPYTPQEKNFNFILEYQGCAEAGLCYPPEEKQFQLTSAIPIASADSNSQDTLSSDGNSAKAQTQPATAQSQAETAAKASDKQAFVPEQEKVVNFLTDKSLVEIVIYFVGLGVLLAFTPCVLPMVPILSSIIVGQGKEISTGKAFSLSLVYTQSMAIPYTIMGIVVGAVGGSLSNTLQEPLFIGIAAAIFVLLSLSMFGFYELQLPQSLQNKLNSFSNSQEGGSYIGAGIMGAISALVVSPCVTVPLAGVLIYIAQTGDQLIGGVALYSLAFGMGIPLLLVGVGGNKLIPKSGGWMNAVKAAFGVIMLGMALFISKHLIPGQLNLVLWAVLLITTAVYMGALSAVEKGIAQLWKGIGVVLLVYGASLLIGAAMGNTNLLSPLKGLSAPQSNASHQTDQAQATHFVRVKSIEDVEAQITKANAAGKTVMFDFFAVSCTACYEFEELVFPNPAVVKALENTVLIQADVTANDKTDKALMKHFGVVGLPSILFFDKNGFEDKRLRAIGLEEPEIFVQRIEAAFTANL